MKDGLIKTLFSNTFIAVGVAIQLIVYILTDSSLLSLVSGTLGIFAVVYCSERKMKQFFFAFGQMFTYVYIAYCEKLYGEVAINIFYFILTCIAVYTWIHNSNDNGSVESRSLTLKGNIILAFSVGLVFLVVWKVLCLTDDAQPMMDSLTTVPAIAAQLLYMLRYREQWIYWLIIDVASIVMWSIAENWCVVAQYVFWTLNCVYGYYLWSVKKRLNDDC